VIKGFYDTQDFYQNKKINYFIILSNAISRKGGIMLSRKSSRTQQHNWWIKTEEVSKKKRTKRHFWSYSSSLPAKKEYA